MNMRFLLIIYLIGEMRHYSTHLLAIHLQTCIFFFAQCPLSSEID